MKFLDIADNEVIELAATGDMPEAVHQFEPRQIRAINAALAARRPLLVRGEPGIGKTQLARAAAKGLGRAFVPHTVDARTGIPRPALAFRRRGASGRGPVARRAVPGGRSRFARPGAAVGGEKRPDRSAEPPRPARHRALSASSRALVGVRLGKVRWSERRKSASRRRPSPTAAIPPTAAWC